MAFSGIWKNNFPILDSFLARMERFKWIQVMQLPEEVFQDKNGEWIFAYNRYFGNCLIFYVELWGILKGLLQRKGHHIIIIQTDNLEVLQAIQEIDSSNSSSALIRRVHNILSHEQQWSIRYISREHNQVVDYFSSSCLSSVISFVGRD